MRISATGSSQSKPMIEQGHRRYSRTQVSGLAHQGPRKRSSRPAPSCARLDEHMAGRAQPLHEAGPARLRLGKLALCEHGDLRCPETADPADGSQEIRRKMSGATDADLT